MEGTSFFVAFGAGVLSFISPCVLPLMPVYLASLAGPEIFEVEEKRRRVPVFLHSLSFVLGFSLVFIILGASAGLIGFAIGSYLSTIHQISGIMLIVFGTYLLLALKITWLNYEKRLSPSLGTTSGYLRSFLTGSVFCVAWTPCIGPVLGGILTMALGSETAGYGAYLLAAYSLGLGLPFLAMGTAFDFMSPLLKRIRRYSTAIYVISGLLLITVGILILMNKLIWY